MCCVLLCCLVLLSLSYSDLSYSTAPIVIYIPVAQKSSPLFVRAYYNLHFITCRLVELLTTTKVMEPHV